MSVRCLFPSKWVHERHEVPFAFSLLHRDANLGRIREGYKFGLQSTDFESTVDLAVLHEVSPRDSAIPILPCIDVFGKVEPHVAKYDSFSTGSGRVLLHDLEMNFGFLQQCIAIDRHPYRQQFIVLPRYFMLSDGFFRGSTAVLGRCRGGEMPFDVRRPGHEWNIVKVEDLSSFQQLELRSRNRVKRPEAEAQI